jgi:phosphatidylinositol alpha-mannosyltransferase
VRIGLVCPYSLTIPGGVQGQVLGLARALRDLGHPTQVLGPCDGPPPEVGVTPLGNSVPAAANGSVAPLAPDPSAQLRTIRALRDEAFDVLHLHEPLAPGPTMTSLLFKNSPMIGTFHAAGESAAYKYASKPLRWLMNRLDLRCAVSNDAIKLAQGYLGGEYTLVFNGIEVSRHAEAEPWPTEGPTILFVGRHEPRKGLDVLLEAMQSLPADTQLWIAGNGPATAELKATYADDDRLHWLGFISEGEKLQRLRGADVLCAPSIGGESFGVVLLEGMSARTAVVAGDIDGYRNVATDGLDALLAAPGDARALAEALTVVISDESRRAALVKAGIETADHYDMVRLAELYVGFYERIA